MERKIQSTIMLIARILITGSMMIILALCFQGGAFEMNHDHKHEHHSSIKPNQLANENSPYLLQHANNPVDWYPWSEEAFDKALKEDKPVFLSIGYSTCHWCHVMEHESFEDPDVAQLMNDAFVSIKVDREERPDIDTVYMTVCQMMTGGGGWPLTIIMTPDKKPFFAATYIPKKARYGLPGMMDIIPRVEKLWKTDRNQVMQIADKASDSLQYVTSPSPGDMLTKDSLADAYSNFDMIFDKNYGGFGAAPKFPSPHNFLFLLRYNKRIGDGKPLEIVEKTLKEMRKGGIYDHIGFGFHRYSTDSAWLVPHFEKMLYDQAMLSLAYTETFLVTKNEEYKNTTEEIFTYVLRDLTSPDGAFYSAEDADSEDEEGKFYVWTEEEIRSILQDEADHFIKVFNIKKDGNFTGEASGQTTHNNIPHLTKSLSELADEISLPDTELKTKLNETRQKLFEAREKRIRPGLDDKILTDWNGLMISAFARASQAFGNPKLAEFASQVADFILKNMRDENGRLYHRYRQGISGINGNLVDYAFFIQSLLDLYEATFKVKYLKSAIELNEDLIEHFWDNESGGFYFTADDSESLIVRTKEIHDSAIPSGNSVAALNLLRIARITANVELEERYTKIVKAFSNDISGKPSAFTYFLCALDFAIGPSFEVVITGKPGSEDTTNMIKALREEYIPNKVVILRPDDESAGEIESISEFVKYQTPFDGKATAYVCQNYSCNEPTTEIEKMLKSMQVE